MLPVMLSFPGDPAAVTTSSSMGHGGTALKPSKAVIRMVSGLPVSSAVVGVPLNVPVPLSRLSQSGRGEPSANVAVYVTVPAANPPGNRLSKVPSGIV